MVVANDLELAPQVRNAWPGDVQVVTATDARAARRLFDETTPVLVIVKVRAGNAGGFGLARDMSQRAELISVPVLMILERPQDTWLANQAGAAATVTEPVSAASIAHRAAELLAVPSPG